MADEGSGVSAIVAIVAILAIGIIVYFGVQLLGNQQGDVDIELPDNVNVLPDDDDVDVVVPGGAT